MDIVDQAAWLAARQELLAKEKELTRARDRVSEARRALPWVRVEKAYGFTGPDGKLSLADLFGGSSQLILYHFMYGPDWQDGCTSCSFLAENFDGSIPHLAARDVSFVAVARAPLDRLDAYKKRMGWSFPWVSSLGSDFNRDFQVSFSAEDPEGEVTYNYRKTRFPMDEAPGISVFARRSGEVYHTYSAYGRGLDTLISTYQYLDLVPKGRDEGALHFPMAWVRRHDQYESS